MFRNSIVTVALVALLSACATLPGQYATTPDTVSEPSWVEERATLEASINTHPEFDAIAMDDGGLLIRLPAAEGFATGETDPTPPLRRLLEEITPLLQAFPDTDLLVLGHTDSIGSELYNLRLSIGRAEAVMDVLRSHGVSLARLTADGRGEAEPIADNATPEGRAINRRVEIVVRPRD